jgi:hypothetical protein
VRVTRTYPLGVLRGVPARLGNPKTRPVAYRRRRLRLGQGHSPYPQTYLGWNKARRPDDRSDIYIDRCRDVRRLELSTQALNDVLDRSKKNTKGLPEAIFASGKQRSGKMQKRSNVFLSSRPAANCFFRFSFLGSFRKFQTLAGLLPLLHVDTLFLKFCPVCFKVTTLRFTFVWHRISTN